MRVHLRTRLPQRPQPRGVDVRVADGDRCGARSPGPAGRGRARARRAARAAVPPTSSRSSASNAALQRRAAAGAGADRPAAGRASVPTQHLDVEQQVEDVVVEDGQVGAGAGGRAVRPARCPASPSARAGTTGTPGSAAASSISLDGLAGLGVRQRHRGAPRDGRPAAGRRRSTPGPRPGSRRRRARKPRSITASTCGPTHAGGHRGREAEPGRAPRPAPRVAEREGLVARRHAPPSYGTGSPGTDHAVDRERDAPAWTAGRTRSSARGGCAPRRGRGCRASPHSPRPPAEGSGARSSHRRDDPTPEAPRPGPQGASPGESGRRPAAATGPGAARSGTMSALRTDRRWPS